VAGLFSGLSFSGFGPNRLEPAGSVALRGEPTGVATCFNADAIATAKRDLSAGDMLDGEGGYTVWGKLLPARKSMALGGLPLGLAQGAKLIRAVKAGTPLSWGDVTIDEALPAVRMRRAMEAAFAEPASTISRVA